jgi:hypothetical protein
MNFPEEVEDDDFAKLNLGGVSTEKSEGAILSFLILKVNRVINLLCQWSFCTIS